MRWNRYLYENEESVPIKSNYPNYSRSLIATRIDNDELASEELGERRVN